MRRDIFVGLVISLLLHFGVLALFFAGSFFSHSDIKPEFKVPVVLNRIKAIPAATVPQEVAQDELRQVAELEPGRLPRPVAKRQPRKPVIKSIPDKILASDEIIVLADDVLEPSTEPVPVDTFIAPVIAEDENPAPPGLQESVEEEYKSKLTQLLDARKRYPRRARRMGREGEVVVSFLIFADGTITQVNITEGSGSSVLDKAAAKAVSSVSGLLPFPQSIERRRWAFTVPISFRLL